MTERPIHFPQPTADAMVRAVLDGSKTQHRIPIDRSVASLVGAGVTLDWLHPNVKAGKESYGFWLNERTACISPFGGPGDLLWMRECFAYGGGINGKPIVYRADWPELKRPCDSGVPYGGGFPDEKWSPSIHMPREACRLTRVVKRVWVEQVQAISHKDAVAEGLEDDAWLEYEDWASAVSGGVPHSRKTLVEHYAEHWDSIYAAKNCGWDANPWVWGCEFESTDEETRATTKGHS